MVAHGSACAQSDQPGNEPAILVAGSFSLPVYANAATIFLNGWRLRYLHGDQNLAGITAIIDRIELSGDELSWRAWGSLHDADIDEGYEFCYYYTILAWNSGRIDALVDHAEGNRKARPCEDVIPINSARSSANSL